MADPRSGAGDTARWRDGHQQRVGRLPRSRRDPPVPVDGRCRGRHRPVAPHRGPAARRPPQGGASRQPDRYDTGVRRCRATSRRCRVRRGREPLRSPREGHARAPRRIRRPRAPDRPGWIGRGRLRSRWDDRPDRGRPLPRSQATRHAGQGNDRDAGHGHTDAGIPVRDPCGRTRPRLSHAASAGARRRPPSRWRSFIDRRVPSRR